MKVNLDPRLLSVMLKGDLRGWEEETECSSMRTRQERERYFYLGIGYLLFRKLVPVRLLCRLQVRAALAYVASYSLL